jgi:hypothetical protein
MAIGVKRLDAGVGEKQPSASISEQQEGAQTPEGYAAADTAPPRQNVFPGDIPDRGNIHVLNGCGIDGAAKKMAEFLRTKHFDVKKIGDIEIGGQKQRNYPATMIISRTADMGVAEELEKILKTGKVTLMRNNDGDQHDVTVIVGPDYEGKIK